MSLNHAQPRFRQVLPGEPARALQQFRPALQAPFSIQQLASALKLLKHHDLLV